MHNKEESDGTAPFDMHNKQESDGTAHSNHQSLKDDVPGYNETIAIILRCMHDGKMLQIHANQIVLIAHRHPECKYSLYNRNAFLRMLTSLSRVK